jgi:hypothetical protein
MVMKHYGPSLPSNCFVLYWMVEVAKSPIAKLDVWFPKQVVMDAMGIIYPQYWLKGLGFRVWGFDS